MLEDSDRLLAHDRPGAARRQPRDRSSRRSAHVRLDLGQIARECVELARTRFHLDPEALKYVEHTASARSCSGDGEELKAAVWNLLDNAVKYSQGEAEDHRRARRDAQQSRRRARDRQRRRDFPGGAEAHLQTVLPHSGERRGPRQGQRPRAVHRPIGRAKKHGGRAFAQSAGQGHGQHVHAAAAGGDRPPRDRPHRIASSSSRTSIIWPKGSASTSKPRASARRSWTIGERALERLLDPAEHVRPRRARRDAAGQGRLRGRQRAAPAAATSCPC